ncbi:MAG: purine-binding chemotaxis protein CheW [Candidatus Azotimanducaceae bacterium]|jgi:purine-binding chemotaxis protein CheW
MSQSDSQVGAEEGEIARGNVQQFLTFVLSDEIYGVGILQIREIIEYDNLTAVPLMPDYISGVINLRGNVVPVVNLALRLAHQPKEVGKRTSIVIINIKDYKGKSVEVGIVVDIVNEVIELSDSDIAAAPTFGAKIRADFIQGMGKADDKLLILLDVDHVLSIEELSTVANMTDELSVPSVSKG